MTYDDSKILAEIQYAAEQDRRIKDDIRKAIDSHDKAFFERIVQDIVDQFHLAVAEVKRIVEIAYRRFRNSSSA